jgi:very-short-patch-repair endonuclease
VRDRTIAALARDQEGVLSRAQLLDRGIHRSSIQRRIDAGVLVSLYPGVYAHGQGSLTESAAALAAVLACGEGALLAYGSAIELRKLLERAGGNCWHVTIPHRKPTGPNAIESLRRGLRPIRVHFTSVLFDGEPTVFAGVPITSVERSLIDFAAHAGEHELARAFDEALIAGLSTREQIAGAVALHRHRPGRRRILALLERDAPPALTLSHAERVLVELLRNAGVDGFETNARVGPYQVDVLWRAARLIVEVDGAAFHGVDFRHERDTRRDADLAAQGYLVIRVTARELAQHPGRAVTRIARTLALRQA